MKHITIDPRVEHAPTRDSSVKPPSSLPPAKATNEAPRDTTTSNGGTKGATDACLYFIGTATTLLEWQGTRILTDPNFLHAGDHVHLGPGVTSQRLTNPAVELHELPRVDLVLLSHYHEDHFDKKVEDSLRRDLPMITTPHANHHLAEVKKGDDTFTCVHPLDHFESLFINIAGAGDGQSKQPAIKMTGMPGKHVPPGPAQVLRTANNLLGIVPPTNGWMVELGYGVPDWGDSTFECGYRIYISGDTLMVDELKEIPERYKDQKIDLMLIHLGGTAIPHAKAPLLMVTMDAVQGLQLVRLINPELTIPIHYDDYDVFQSPLKDFKHAMEKAGLQDKVVYLDRGDKYLFSVQKS